MNSLPQILFLVLAETEKPREAATDTNWLFLVVASLNVSVGWFTPVIHWIASVTDCWTKGVESGWCWATAGRDGLGVSEEAWELVWFLKAWVTATAILWISWSSDTAWGDELVGVVTPDLVDVLVWEGVLVLVTLCFSDEVLLIGGWGRHLGGISVPIGRK